MQWRDLLPSSSFDIDRERNRLTVTARDSLSVYFSVLSVGFLAFWLIAWVRQEWNNPGNLLFGLLIWLALSSGLSTAVPRHVITVFDLDQRRIQQTSRGALSRRDITRSYNFAEIASVGLKEEDEGYKLVLTLKAGNHRYISVAAGGTIKLGQTIDAIYAATGLPRVDVPVQNTAR